MATDLELSNAALAFIEQSDNRHPEKLSRTIFGERGHGYLFEYDDHIGLPLVIEWDPVVDADGRFHEMAWEGDTLESFIGGIAFCAGIKTSDEEIEKIVEIIKLHLPETDTQ